LTKKGAKSDPKLSFEDFVEMSVFPEYNTIFGRFGTPGCLKKSPFGPHGSYVCLKVAPVEHFFDVSISSRFFEAKKNEKTQ
jgi:hypothetical protein